jgi:ribosomal protein S18 acetylase RimI-like enzyme
MVITRLVTAEDVDVLWDMVYWAAHVDEDDGVTHADMRRDPDLVGHVDDWGRLGDLGVIGEFEGTPVGAAWLRLFVPGVSDYSAFVDDETPELVVAVVPAHVGRGIGSLLLTALYEHADEMYETTVLSVRTGNPAVRLYERFGFRELDRHVNRVGTESARMLRRSPGTSARG